jgi:hypothetical protein
MPVTNEESRHKPRKKERGTHQELFGESDEDPKSKISTTNM